MIFLFVGNYIIVNLKFYKGLISWLRTTLYLTFNFCLSSLGSCQTQTRVTFGKFINSLMRVLEVQPFNNCCLYYGYRFMQPSDKSIESFPIFSASKYASSQFLSVHSLKIMSVHQSISIACYDKSLFRQFHLPKCTGYLCVHRAALSR